MILAKVLFGIGLVVLAGCATGESSGGSRNQDQAPETESLNLTATCDGDWTRIKANDAFSFCLPPGMEKQAGTGVDSFVAQYWSATIQFSFDYGWYSDPLKYYSEFPKYREDLVEVAGKPAKLISYDEAEEEFGYKSAIYWNRVGEDEKIHLGMWVRCRTAEDREEARKIFSSTILASP